METRSRLIILLFSLTLLQFPLDSVGHGYMWEPVSRSTAWRQNFSTPVNYDDDSLYCGGFGIQWDLNSGKCGVCGDAYSDPIPRSNENGGEYGTNTIVRSYRSGDKVQIVINLTTNHRGHFEFHVCPRQAPNAPETEECFEANPIRMIDGSFKYRVPKGDGVKTVTGYLPKGLKCKYCTLRWHYRAGNNWDICPDGHGALGCGPQETFRNCADVSIL